MLREVPRELRRRRREGSVFDQSQKAQSGWSLVVLWWRKWESAFDGRLGRGWVIHELRELGEQDEEMGEKDEG